MSVLKERYHINLSAIGSKAVRATKQAKGKKGGRKAAAGGGGKPGRP